MEESTEVRDAMLAFYDGVSTSAVERFDDIVSGHPATLVIGTAPGEWVTERPKLRFGFEAEGAAIRPGKHLTGYSEGTMGWVVDDPVFSFPGATVNTRLTAVFRHEDNRWKLVHMHVSVGVPDEQVQALQESWGAGQA